MSYTTITASGFEDLSAQLAAFENSFNGTGEVVNYRVPVIDSNGAVDTQMTPNAGGNDTFQESRRALVYYFNDFNFQPQAVQAIVKRLSDGTASDWMSFADAQAFVQA